MATLFVVLARLVLFAFGLFIQAGEPSRTPPFVGQLPARGVLLVY